MNLAANKHVLRALRLPILISAGLHLLLLVFGYQAPGDGSGSKRIEARINQAAPVNEKGGIDAPGEHDSAPLDPTAQLPLTPPSETVPHDWVRQPDARPQPAPETQQQTSGLPLAQFNDDGYYPIKDVNVIPRLAKALPGNPEELKLFPESGALQLELFIDEFGKVRKVKAWPSDLPESFKRFAVMAFLKSPFKPASKDNLPVKCRMQIIVEFTAVGPDGLPQLSASQIGAETGAKAALQAAP